MLTGSDLLKKVQELRPEVNYDLLTSKEAADLLGITTEQTIKDWLEGEHFPGVLISSDGRKWFPRKEVEKVKLGIELLMKKNYQRDLTVPDLDKEHTFYKENIPY